MVAGPSQALTALPAPHVRVLVVETEGSAPREAGAFMQIGLTTTEGTIGGGALEFQAISQARDMLRTSDTHAPGWQRQLKAYPLGPTLGQCCGGFVRLLFEVFGPDEMAALQALQASEGPRVLVRPLQSGIPPIAISSRKDTGRLPPPVRRIIHAMLTGERPLAVVLVRGARGAPAMLIEPTREQALPLYIYGAGHVGRAIVRVLEDLPFAITWVDTARARFPDIVPSHALMTIAADPTAIAKTASPSSAHLVLTYSHPLDLAICETLLKKADFIYLGLIGSETKKVRFLKRLREAGLPDGTLARLTCPIGAGFTQGKAPAVIAIAVACELIERAVSRDRRGNQTHVDCKPTAP